MLSLIEVRTTQGSLLSLDPVDVSDGLVVEEIEGLDPVKATLVSSSFATMDGEQYQSARREARNIKLKIGLEPDYATQSVRGLRDRLYDFFMPKSAVNLTFYIDNLNVTIDGRVETFETMLFSKDPVVDISVMCFDPDFTDPDDVTISGNTVSTTVETSVLYDGTVESGIIFTLNVNRSVNDVTIYHRPPDGVIRTLAFSAPLLSGDKLVIDTRPGLKGATLTRTGVSSSVLYGISPQSAWTSLEPGQNWIRVYATGAGIPFTIVYEAKYGGL